MKRASAGSISQKRQSPATRLERRSKSSQQPLTNDSEADVSEILEALPVAPEPLLDFQSGQSTSKKAAAILVRTGAAFVVPTASQRQNLLVAFAKKGKVVYGKAFDIVKVVDAVNLDDLADIENRLSLITIYEIKSSRKSLPPDFSGFFFALTGAEILVAQSLKRQFKFAFVNTNTESYLELSLNEIFGRARGIYATWSICF